MYVTVKQSNNIIIAFYKCLIYKTNYTNNSATRFYRCRRKYKFTRIISQQDFTVVVENINLHEQYRK